MWTKQIPKGVKKARYVSIPSDEATDANHKHDQIGVMATFINDTGKLQEKLLGLREELDEKQATENTKGCQQNRNFC